MANRIRAENGTSPPKGVCKTDHEKTDRARSEESIVASRLPEKRLFHLDSSSFTKRKRRDGRFTEALGEEATIVDYIKKEVHSDAESDNETIVADDESSQLSLS